MFYSLLLVLCVTSIVSATSPGAALFKRQSGTTCPAGLTQCGVDDCYNVSTEVCCSSASVHCDAGKYCVVDSKGNTGCCTNGKVCSGNVSGTITQLITGAATATTAITRASSSAIVSASTIVSSASRATVSSSSGASSTSPSSVVVRTSSTAAVVSTIPATTASSSSSTSTSRSTTAAAVTTTIIQSASGAMVTAPLIAAGGMLVAQIFL